MKRSALTLALVMALVLPAIAQEKTDDEPLVAMINGQKVTVAKFNHLWEQIGPEMQKNYELSGGGKIGFLDNYIERILVVQQAVKENFDKRPSIVFELEKVRDSTVFNHYINDVVAPDVIPEADLRAYYNTHKPEFSQREARKARHIVATPISQPVYNSANDDAPTDDSARKKIAGLQKQLAKTPGNFADLASKFGEDLSAKSGGDLGWIEKGLLSAPLEKALFSLEVGQVSEVVHTEFGYHVIICEGIREAGIKPFEEARPAIAEKFASENRNDLISALRQLTNELRRSSTVTVFRENL